VEGLRIALAPDGVIVMEFPHLMRLVEGVQFDTIYHEHFSYFSFATVCTIFQKHGLEVFDVEELPEHGGSLRIYAQHELKRQERTYTVSKLITREQNNGMFTLDYYDTFQPKINGIRHDLVDFLYMLKDTGEKIAAYGAPAKGNTLLNFCKIDPYLIPFTVDRSPHKQGLYCPGSHIPVVDEDRLKEAKPDFVLILPWNLKAEIMKQLEYIREWGGKFVTAIPRLTVEP
jgi:hypothetical protein